MKKTGKQEKAEEKALTDLQEVARQYASDPEKKHLFADGVLCRLLLDLGYEKVVQVYQQIDPMWAA